MNVAKTVGVSASTIGPPPGQLPSDRPADGDEGVGIAAQRGKSRRQLGAQSLGVGRLGDLGDRGEVPPGGLDRLAGCGCDLVGDVAELDQRHPPAGESAGEYRRQDLVAEAFAAVELRLELVGAVLGRAQIRPKACLDPLRRTRDDVVCEPDPDQDPDRERDEDCCQ